MLLWQSFAPTIDHRDGRPMPRIIVSSQSTRDSSEDSVVLDERIAADDLSSDHFAAQLIERIGWALLDADGAERRPAVL
jgi:hypothetical protein